MKLAFAVVALLVLAALVWGRPAATVYADEWTEYPGPELPEYDIAPTPLPPSGLPNVYIYAPRTNATGIEVIAVLSNPPLWPLPTWPDPILSGISVEHAGQHANITVDTLLDVPYWLARASIPGCTPDRYCHVELRSHVLVPNGDGRYELLDSNALAVMLPPLP